MRFPSYRSALIASLSLVSLFVSVSAAAPLKTTKTLSPVEQHYIQLDKIIRDSSGKENQAKISSEAYERFFRSLQNSSNLEKANLDDLQALFMAAGAVDFYWPSDQHVADLRLDFMELSRRNAQTQEQTSTVYSALYQARKFSELNKFFSEHAASGLPPPPHVSTISDSMEHSILRVSPDHNRLVRSHADLDIGSHILVIGHPLCHFTQNAAKAIDKNLALKRIFKKDSVWVSPPDRNLDLSPFQEWNKKHPEFAMSIGFAKSSWPEVKVWQTPTFIFMKDGKVVDEVIGWPNEGNMDALDAGLTKIGIKLN